MDIVEIDPVIVTLAQRYFNININGKYYITVILFIQHFLHIHYMICFKDVHKFLNSPQNKSWDLVLFDIYYGESRNEIYTENLIQSLKRILTEEGVLAIV